MQIVFAAGAERRELDLRINDPAATVADLVAALDPGGTTNRRLLIGDHLAGPDHDLDECGLHEGAVVSIAEWGRTEPPTQGRLTLEVIGGLDGGRRLPLPVGLSVLGRESGCDLVLESHTVSRRHAEVTLDEEGRVRVRDLESLNGTWVDGQPVTSEVGVATGSIVRFGALQTMARTPTTDDRPMAVDPLRHVNAAGTIPFNRPPRPAPPPPLDAIEVPEPPKTSTSNAAFNIVAFIAPLVLAGALFAATRQVGFLAFTLLSPIMVLGNWIQGKIRGRRGSRRETERFAKQLATFQSELFGAVTTESARLDTAHPDPAEVMRRVLLPSTRLWERRPHDPDFLRLRSGLGDVPWTPPVDEVKKDAPEELTAAVRGASTLTRAPVAVDLSAGGVVGIVGDRPAAVALARSLVCQAAVHHGPADLPTVVLVHPDRATEWDWTKWLPHTRDPGGGSTRLLSADPELSNRMVEGWLQQESEHERERGRKRRDQQGPTLFVVVDDESLTEGRRAPARTLLRGGAGPVAGIVIASTSDRLPAVCTTVIDLQGPDGEATLHLPQLGRRIDRFLAAGMADDTARECARALARFEDPELTIVGAGLPDMIRLLPLLDLDEIDADAVLSRWKAAGADPPPAAPIGMAEDGVFTVNLHADGPHALVGGTTGSGKSELLRTLVAGLAANTDPEHLTFVLIDFKGGSAFDECARLPHTVGMVTDLDEHLAERALRCLEAELKFRERVLREAGATDLPMYLRGGRATEPLPRLLVVVDEFATLKAELPEFVDALVGVAQRGRSLGVHMVLATQRPSGAVSDNIRANTNLRIALRVQDDGDSSDIIDRPDAARLPRHAAGRAYVRLGAGEVVPIQTALATAARLDGVVTPVDAAPFRFGPSPRPQPAASLPLPVGGDEHEGEKVTDLALLVESMIEAHRRTGRPAPRRPWPDPLPNFVDLDRLLMAAPPPDPAAPEATIALADDPDRQTQYPTGWQPAQGNLLIYGVGGAGTTGTLGAIALSLARLHPADRLHLYALDFGAGELDALEALPHTGAVIGAPERERQMRLVRFLRSELDRRRDLTAEARAAEPMIVVFVDGYAAFNAEYRDLIGMTMMDEFQRVFADGPEVAIHTILTADRAGAVPSAMASLVRQKLLLRLADPYDYAQFGIPSKTVPKFGPGGAMVAETRQVIQVAMPVDDLASAARRYARIYPEPSRRPATIGLLPVDVALDRLRAEAELDIRPWRIPVGITEAELGPGWLVVYEGEHGLVAGPARSGKTSTLAALATTCRAARADLVVVTLAPARSPLPSMIDPEHHLAPDRLATELLPLITPARPTLLLVDDADAVDDPMNVLSGLLGGASPADLFVVAAGRSESLRGSFSHWTRSLRRSKLGVLLRPNVDLDGELLGVNLPRRVPVAMTVGRGFLVNSGDVEIIQVAHP